MWSPELLDPQAASASVRKTAITADLITPSMLRR